MVFYSDVITNSEGRVLFEFHVEDRLLDADSSYIKSNLPHQEMDRLLEKLGTDNCFHYSKGKDLIEQLKELIKEDREAQIFAYPDYLLKFVAPDEKLVDELKKRCKRIKPTGLISKSKRPLWHFALYLNFLTEKKYNKKAFANYNWVDRTVFEDGFFSSNIVEEYIENYHSYTSFLKSYKDGVFHYAAFIDDVPQFMFNHR